MGADNQCVRWLMLAWMNVLCIDACEVSQAHAFCKSRFNKFLNFHFIYRLHAVDRPTHKCIHFLFHWFLWQRSSDMHQRRIQPSSIRTTRWKQRSIKSFPCVFPPKKNDNWFSNRYLELWLVCCVTHTSSTLPSGSALVT